MGRYTSKGSTIDGQHTFFIYDDSGKRTTKGVGSVYTYYHYDGDKLVAEYWDDCAIVYIYNAMDSTPIGFTYRSESEYNAYSWDVYWYEKNLQGDIVAIYDDYGTKLISYKYDAWGNFSTTYHNGGASTSAVHNRLTYRGYYYDSDLGFYCTGTRYYDPIIGRWINADSQLNVDSMLGCNLYAYCNNNPVMYVDHSGKSGTLAVLAGGMKLLALAGAIIGLAWLIYDATHEQKLGKAVSNIADDITSAFKSITESKADEKDETLSPQTVIYRYGGTNPSNLTPKEKDKYSGLSFSTVPMPGAAMTTIEALNATGVVYAVKDGATHVTVKPVGATVEEWIEAGSGSVWTQAVKSVIIKWGR